MSEYLELLFRISGILFFMYIFSSRAINKYKADGYKKTLKAYSIKTPEIDDVGFYKALTHKVDKVEVID